MPWKPNCIRWAVDDARFLQLAETLAVCRGKLRTRAESLDVAQRQHVLRLLVKEILVGKDTITIRHSLPITPSGSSGSGSEGINPAGSGMIGELTKAGYLLRSWSRFAADCERVPALRIRSVGGGLVGFQHRRDASGFSKNFECTWRSSGWNYIQRKRD